MKHKRRSGAGRPPLENPPAIVHIALRLYSDTDTDLITWMASIPHRYRSSAVKAALRTGNIGSVAIEDLTPDDELDAAVNALLM